MFGSRKHLSDWQIVSHVAGELPVRSEAAACSHLHRCEQCRTRCDELKSVLREVENSYRQQYSPPLLSEDAARRVLIRSLLVEQSTQPDHSQLATRLMGNRKLALSIASVAACLAIGIAIGKGFQESVRRAEIARSMPDSRLTPGATLELTRQAVCSAANVKNKPVPVVLQRKVLQEYGIARETRQAYEVDYLVTPALGGAEDIRNLWPQSFSPDWNARVKDDLEDRLREMVCSGDLDLTEAQREIATNWIGAYKKYFHTDHPLPAR